MSEGAPIDFDTMNLRDFARHCERAQREGDLEALAAIDARHRALGYGGPVVDEGGVMAACQPGPLATGPRVECCSCGDVMLAWQFEGHVERFEAVPTWPAGWCLHSAKLAEAGRPTDIIPAIVAELPSIDAPELSEPDVSTLAGAA